MGIWGCRPPTYVPKPPGYYNLDTPAEHFYKLFDEPGFPYSFEYPAYGIIKRDTVFASKGDQSESRYWINMLFPDYSGIINITFKYINSKQPLDKLNEQSFEMSFFNHEKAAYMDNTEFANGKGTNCVIYTIGGNVATRYQFTATDNTVHFMRGALYFDVTPNADSLKPISDFVERDIEHMLKTLIWHER
jgi:gliding motility-associated lipoprotein GldD